jgi:hypothetical protein
MLWLLIFREGFARAVKRMDGQLAMSVEEFRQ